MVARNFKAVPAVDNESLLVTQSGAGAVERTVESKLNDFINVKDFGAAGDGVQDDTLAIQAAIDYAETLVTPHVTGDPKGGATVYFDGIFKVTDTLKVSKSNISLTGSGRTTLLVYFTSPSTYYNLARPVIQVGTAEAWYNGTLSSTTKYNSISNLNFQRLNLIDSLGFTAIFASGTRNLTIDNLLIERAAFGLYLENTSEALISSVAIIGTNYGIVGDSRYNTTSDQNFIPLAHGANDFSSNRFDMITCYYIRNSGFYLIGAGTTQVTGCTFGHNCSNPNDSPFFSSLPTGYGAVTLISSGQQIRGLLFQDCVFEPDPSQTTGDSYQIRLIGADQKAVGVTFENCVVQTYRSFNSVWNTVNFNEDAPNMTVFLKTSGTANRFFGVRISNSGFINSSSGYFFGKFIEQDVAAGLILDNIMNSASISASTLKSAPLFLGKKTVYFDPLDNNATPSGWSLTGSAPSVTQNNAEPIIREFTGASSYISSSFRLLNYMNDSSNPYLMFSVKGDGDLYYDVLVNGGAALATLTSDSPGRYSNAAVPMLVANDGTWKTFIVTFVPFSFNYGFTTLTARLGTTASNTGSIFIKDIEVGLLPSTGSYLSSP